MIILKTSGETFNSVINNQKHASKGQPDGWFPGETILISKNKVDCKGNEKQIQYIARLEAIRKIQAGEIERLWPGNEGRWEYLWIFKQTSRLAKPFNLEEVLGSDAKNYHPVVTFAKLKTEHEKMIEDHLKLAS